MIARRAWPWATAAALLPALAFAAHVFARYQGDVSAAYFVTRPAYEHTVLVERYAPDELHFREALYDSAIFLALANDPAVVDSLERPPSDLFYRARRIAWPATAWGLAAGRPRAILYTLPLATALAIAAAALAVGTMLVSRGRHPAWSLLAGLSLGVTVCMVRPLADAFATSWMVLGLAAWTWRWRGVAVAAFVVAVLSKETTILAPALLGVAHLVRRRPLREALPLGLVPLAMLAWWTVLALRIGRVELGGEALAVPFSGIVTTLRDACPDDLVGRSALAATLLATIAPLGAARRHWDATRAVTAAFAALALCSGVAVWEEVWAYGRVHMTLPALGLWLYARGGPASDLIGPLASAGAALVLWHDRIL